MRKVTLLCKKIKQKYYIYVYCNNNLIMVNGTAKNFLTVCDGKVKQPIYCLVFK